MVNLMAARPANRGDVGLHCQAAVLSATQALDLICRTEYVSNSDAEVLCKMFWPKYHDLSLVLM